MSNLFSFNSEIELRGLCVFLLKSRRGSEDWKTRLAGEVDWECISPLFFERSFGIRSSKLPKCFSTNICCASGGRVLKTCINLNSEVPLRFDSTIGTEFLL